VKGRCPDVALPGRTNHYLYPPLSYEPVADFAPITLIGLYPLMMVVPNSSAAHSVREFIAYAKVNKPHSGIGPPRQFALL
jgi:tripartite-type tricarboxylate transporter receptor subunit TctC